MTISFLNFIFFYPAFFPDLFTSPPLIVCSINQQMLHYRHGFVPGVEESRHSLRTQRDFCSAEHRLVKFHYGVKVAQSIGEVVRYT